MTTVLSSVATTWPTWSPAWHGTGTPSSKSVAAQRVQGQPLQGVPQAVTDAELAGEQFALVERQAIDRDVDEHEARWREVDGGPGQDEAPGRQVH